MVISHVQLIYLNDKKKILQRLKQQQLHNCHPFSFNLKKKKKNLTE